MKHTVPSAHVVFTARWLIALLIRVWVLLEVVRQTPGPVGYIQQVIADFIRNHENLHDYLIANPSASSGTFGVADPTFNTYAVFEVAVQLLLCCLIFLPAAIWAGWFAKAIAPIPAGAGLAPSGTSTFQHFKRTAWWWSMILLRLWSLRMVAMMAVPIWSIVGRHMQFIQQVLDGRVVFNGINTVNGVIWLGIKAGVLETWMPFTIAAVLWFFAGRLGRFLTTEPVTPSCPSCGYLATTTTCSECGTQLTPLPQADPSTASASPPPPHQPPAASA